MAYLPHEDGHRIVNNAVYRLLGPATGYREIADALGIHERTLYKWLSGERRVPKMAILAFSFLLNKGNPA